MFDARFTAEVAMRTRSGHPLSCIALDVDHFKDIHDKHGHPFGDHVLGKIAEALIECCRVEDVACRYGGEEFIVLAPRTSGQHAAALAERMRIAIAKIPLTRQGQPVTATGSFGVAEAIGIHDGLMLDRVDQALYKSKEHGRNRVSMAPSPRTPKTAAA